MVIEIDAKSIDIFTVLEQGLEPIISTVNENSLLAARRIKSVLLSNRDQSYLKPLFLPEFSEPEIYVTDRAEKIFGETQTIYTITSSLALENIRDGEILLPPSVHNEGTRQVSTHRGIGLALFSRLMRGFGFGVQAKDSFVWLGPKIDGEQFVLEDNIARSGHEVDRVLAEKLFAKSDVKKDYAHLTLHPQLKAVIEAIGRGDNLYKSDQKIRQYIDDLLTNIHRYTGVREGWFNALEGLLTGTIPPAKRIDPTDLDLSLTFVANQLALESPKKSQAIVLAVDTQKLIELTPIYAFPLCSRPPDTIIPSLHVPLAAVKQIYSEESGLDSPSHKPIMPISALPTDSWLQNDHGDYVTPEIARRNGINPRTPACLLRYNHDPVATWARHIEAGDIAPYTATGWLDLCDPKSFTDQALQKIIIDRASQSGLLAEIEQITHDRNTATRRILADAMYKLSLQPVKYI